MIKKIFSVIWYEHKKEKQIFLPLFKLVKLSEHLYDYILITKETV